MTPKQITWAGSIILLLTLFTANIHAADFGKPSYRSKTGEATVGIRYTAQEAIDFEGGAKADVSSDYGWGFGLGYNVNDNIGLSADFSWLSASYQATRVDDTGSPSNYNGIMDASSIVFRGTYYFMKTRMTPFISANLGWTFIDTNIPIGPPGTVCWWDPWFGWICGPYVPTATQNAFGYGGGLGLRWDISTTFFMKAAYNWTRLDIANTTGGDPTFGSVVIDFGFFMN
ncbi:outer membrane protein [Kaarinaea lacus]